MDVILQIKEIAKRLDARQGEMVHLLTRLVEMESPSDDFTSVNAFAEVLLREMRQLGFDAIRRAVPRSPDLVECYHGRGNKSVMLLGHMDTVWPIGTLLKRPVRVDGDRLYGPGCFDMKAGIVVALYAAHVLGERCPRIHFFMTSQEEVSGEPYRAILEERARKASAVICLEPAWPGGAVKTERKGAGHIKMTAHGRSAHAGSEPERGVNAIVEIANQVIRLRELQRELKNGVTMVTGLIRGGTRRNVVPDFAEIDVDLRFKRMIDGEDTVRRVKAFKPFLPEATLDVEAGISVPPLERSSGVQTLFALASRVEEALGRKLREVSTGGVSEANYVAACGVPVIDGIGADGDGAHAENENVLLASLPQRAALLAGTLLLQAQEHSKSI